MFKISSALDPYSTSFGSTINTTKLEESLFKIISTSEDLSYGYKLDDEEYKISFITGNYDVDENNEQPPLWEHPIIIKDVREITHTVVDLRKYLNTTKGRPHKIEDAVSNYMGYELAMTRGLITAMLVSGDYGIIRLVSSNIALAFGLFIGNVLGNSIPINIKERYDMEVIATYYMLLKLTRDGDDLKESLMKKVATQKFSLGADKVNNFKLLEKIDIEENFSTIEDLLNQFKEVVDEPKKKYLTDDVIINIVGSYLYNNTELMLIALENSGTWAAIVYNSLNNKAYKKTKLATLLTRNYKQTIKSSDILKHMTLRLEKYTQ